MFAPGSLLRFGFSLITSHFIDGSSAGGKVNVITKKDRRACLSMAEQRGPAAIKEKLNSDPSSGIDGAQRGNVQDKATR